MKLRVTSALFALFMLSSAFASAQLSPAEKKAAARTAYKEGVAFQEEGKPGLALAKFEIAQQNFDAPTHLLHIAECQALTGKLVEATETYETLTHYPLAKDSSEVFVQAQEQGKAELESLKKRVPTMRVLIKPDPQTLKNLQISVNDKQLPADLVDIPRPVNPGSYRLSAAATGWGTPTATEVEVHEKDASVVTLTLQKGATAAVVIAPIAPGTGAPANPTTSTTTSNTPATPAPYDQPAKPGTATTGPSALGLLIGGRGLVFVPGGSTKGNEKFSEVATAGGGFALDLIGRVGRIFLVGGTLEFAFPAGVTPRTPAADTHVEVTNTSVYAGISGGFMPNVDRVSFIGDVSLGFRHLSNSKETTAVLLGATNTETKSYSGLEAGLSAGISFPAGPLRFVPKLGISVGSFTSGNCTNTGLQTCATGVTDFTDSASHLIFTAGLGLYYHIDLGKKPKVAIGFPSPTTASR